jgi:ribosome modulation factor
MYIFSEGFDDYLSGRPYEQCPYDRDTPEWYSWRIGWEQAQDAEHPDWNELPFRGMEMG